MLWIDIQYANEIAHRLNGYKLKSQAPYLSNFKCPICGDSAKKKSKKRGYFYQHKGFLVFKCHNCNGSMSFGNFLKDFDHNLYDRYTLDRYRNGASFQHTKKDSDIVDTIKSIVPPETKKYVPNVTDDLKSISELKDDHPVKLYIINRKIPEIFWNNIFYAPKYFKWANQHTDKFKNVSENDHPRLIIPWYSSDGILFAYTARSFGNEQPKYFKIIIDDSYPPFYGMDRVKEPKYIVEGPIDSLFLPDCIAVGTSSLHMYDSKNAIYITDRDIRNKEIMKEAKRLIDSDKKVCMLPDNLNGKDINEFVQNGMSVEEIESIIQRNTYQGLEAKLKFIEWSKT